MTILLIVVFFNQNRIFCIILKEIINEETTKNFLDNIYQYYRLLINIIFDQGPQLISSF